MSSKSRNKGGKWERDLKVLFEEFTGVTWERVRGSGAFEKKGDIYPAYESFPFLIEAKHTQGWSFHDIFNGTGVIYNDWWPKICEEACGANRLPMLICKKNYRPPLILLSKRGVNKLRACSKNHYVHNKSIYVYKLHDIIIPSKGKSLVK